MDWNSLFDHKLAFLKENNQKRELALPWGISFSHNDYLGLSDHPEIVQAGIQALEIFGAGSMGSRLLGGNRQIFETLEEEIAEFFDAPSSLFFSSGYLANLAGICVLSHFAKEIVSDERNHASLIDGIRLAGLPKEIVTPMAWSNVSPKEHSLLVMESLYGMDGDFGPLNEFDHFLNLKKPFLWVDEAHAAGIFGESGKGLWQPKLWDHTAKVVTFGKAFGVSGAAVLCSKKLKELILSLGRGFIFTTAPPPAIAAMVRTSLEVVRREPERRVELHERALMVRTLWESEIGLKKKIGIERKCPLIALPLPGKDKALRFAENMRESEIDLRAIRYPTVPEGKERIRVSLNLRVSLENTMAMAEEVVRKWTEFS